MSTSNGLKVRCSVRDLQSKYEKGEKQPLEDLVRAWKGIKDLSPSDKKSFFALGGYHGEPFQYRRQVDDLSDVDRYTYWGGYCNHGNVLFPTWHRIYVLKLEQALQSIVPGVTMPYWDETSEETRKKGIPWVLTNEKFKFSSGEEIDNPLRSFVLPEALSDDIPGEDRLYEKPKGYETVRYPLSGLVGTEEARSATKNHNDRYPNYEQNVCFLNENIVAWLEGPEPKTAGNKTGCFYKYRECLSAPNYTVFSNTTSASQWNLDRPNESQIIPLESPHNDMHLAVGGFDAPGIDFEAGDIKGANGDMGENNTAAMDPIFFFHHCHVDRMFWLWQKKHGCTDEFSIIEGYYGTNSSDSQGPTPGIPPGTPLNLKTPLNPFVKDEFGNIYTSEDCINIEKQLGYTYAPGSLEEDLPLTKAVESHFSGPKLMVRGLDRARFQGSFVVKVYTTFPNEKGESEVYYLGHYSVLSRWNVIKCANCLTHLEVIAHFPLPKNFSSMLSKQNNNPKFEVRAQARAIPQSQIAAGILNAQFKLDPGANSSLSNSEIELSNIKTEVIGI